MTGTARNGESEAPSKRPVPADTYPAARVSPPSFEVVDWTKEEYRLLSSHYFHEDNFYLKSNGLFLSVSTALLAFLKFPGGSATATQLAVLVPIVGAVTAVAWFFSLMRTRGVRRRIEHRIEELERSIQSIWTEAGETPFGGHSALRLRAHDSKPHLLGRIPSTVVMLFLPLTFLLIWIYVLIA